MLDVLVFVKQHKSVQYIVLTESIFSSLWLPYVIRQVIIFSSYGFFFFFLLLLSFLLFAYSELSEIGCLPYFHT